MKEYITAFGRQKTELLNLKEEKQTDKKEDTPIRFSTSINKREYIDFRYRGVLNFSRLR